MHIARDQVYRRADVSFMSVVPDSLQENLLVLVDESKDRPIRPTVSKRPKGQFQ